MSAVVNSSDFRLPNRRQRITIMGRNGSGKTQAAAWILSLSHFDRQPYIIIDYKYDDLLNAIPRVKEIGVKSSIPKTPGLYIVHPVPTEDDDVEKLMWRIWEKEKTGLYVDEAYMLPDRGAYQALLTQGRSKSIPIISITQRPIKVNRFAISEANYYYIFHMNDRRDRKTVEEFVPIDLDEPLPKFHGWWHDVDQYSTFKLKPVPDKDIILETFDRRLPQTWFGSPRK